MDGIFAEEKWTWGNNDAATERKKKDKNSQVLEVCYVFIIPAAGGELLPRTPGSGLNKSTQRKKLKKKPSVSKAEITTNYFNKN